MPVSIPTLSFDQVMDRLLRRREPHQAQYLAMYSSWYGGIVRDPSLMLIPIDDHVVHRADGVFEAFKCVGGRIYLLDRHLDRLEISSGMLDLAWPMARPELTEMVLETVRAGDTPDCMIRLFMSRGPGGFTANPYECIGTQLHVVVAVLKRPSAEKYARGVTLMSSKIPMKSPFFATVKSCAYLPNALMAKEALDTGVDYSVSIDEQGFLGEGPTENIGIITHDREFLVPRFNRILRGTTVSRMLELAAALVETGELTRVAEADVTREQACKAAEMLVLATSFDVLPVASFDGETIGDGKPGPFFEKFTRLMAADQVSGAGVVTPVWR